MADGTLSQLDRSLVQIELNGSLLGRKPGAIPVHLRQVYNGQVSKGLICTTKRNGSSGRSYYALDTLSATPEGNPYPGQEDGCNWYLVVRRDKGERRYEPMVIMDGEERRIGTGETDTVAGYRVVVGTLEEVIWQLVGIEREGQQLPP